MPSQMVTMQFDAQTQTFIANVLKAKEALEATAVKARESGEAIAKSGDKSASAFSGMQGSVAGLVGSYVGLGAGVAAFGKIASDTFEDLNRKAATYSDRMATIGKTLSNAGQASEFTKVKESLLKLADGAVNPDGGAKLFAGISDRVGAKFSADDKLSAFEQSIRAKRAGFSEDRLPEFGEEFLHMKKTMRDAGQNLTNADVGNATRLLLQNKPGGVSDKEHKLMAEMKNKDVAANVLLAAAKANEPAKALGVISDLENEEWTAHDEKHWKDIPKSERTDEDARKRAVGAIPKGERFTAAMTDMSLIAHKDRAVFENLQRNFDPTAFGQAMNNDMQGGLIAARRNLAKTDPDAAVMRRNELAQEALNRDAAGAEGTTTSRYILGGQAFETENEADMQRRLKGEPEWKKTIGNSPIGVQARQIASSIDYFFGRGQAPADDAKHDEHMDKLDEHNDKLIHAIKTAGRRTELGAPGDDK